MSYYVQYQVSHTLCGASGNSAVQSQSQTATATVPGSYTPQRVAVPIDAQAVNAHVSYTIVVQPAGGAPLSLGGAQITGAFDTTPLPSAGTVTAITPTSATLEGDPSVPSAPSLDFETPEVVFHVGTDTSYATAEHDSRVSAPVGCSTPATWTTTGLQPGTLYHFALGIGFGDWTCDQSIGSLFPYAEADGLCHACPPYGSAPCTAGEFSSPVPAALVVNLSTVAFGPDQTFVTPVTSTPATVNVGASGGTVGIGCATNSACTGTFQLFAGGAPGAPAADGATVARAGRTRRRVLLASGRFRVRGHRTGKVHFRFTGRGRRLVHGGLRTATLVITSRAPSRRVVTTRSTVRLAR